MPTNRRPSTPGASPRPGGGRGGGGARGDGRSSTGRARGTSGPTTSRSDAGTSSRSGAGTGAPKAGPAKGAGKDASTAKGSGPATGAGRKPAAPRKPSATPGGSGTGGRSGGSSKSSTSTTTRAARTARTPRTPRPTASTRAPALADRRRSRNGLLLPEVVTVRSLVIAVVVLLAVVLLLPTLRAYVNQTGELRALRAEVAAAEAERDDLQVQLGRLDDEAYVIAQARDRLSYVMPGERAWRVIDPDTVVDDLDPETGRKITDGPVGVEGNDGAPWYTSLWRSVQLAGEQPAPGDSPVEQGSDGPPATDAPTP